jgi:hypothetical protein
MGWINLTQNMTEQWPSVNTVNESSSSTEVRYIMEVN